MRNQENTFDLFTRYNMEIFLSNFTAKAEQEDIFKLTIGNVRLNIVSSVNSVGFS